MLTCASRFILKVAANKMLVPYYYPQPLRIRRCCARKDASASAFAHPGQRSPASDLLSLGRVEPPLFPDAGRPTWQLVFG